jgi:Spy/CpxP family protein refolding chaperone
MEGRKLMNTNVSAKILSLAGLLLAATFVPASFAQTSAPEQSAPLAASQSTQPENKHGDRLAGLNLTDDQKAQIKQIRQDAKAKADAVKADASLSNADKRAKLKAIHRDARMQRRKVFTPEQRKQLKTKVRERRAARKQQSSLSM